MANLKVGDIGNYLRVIAEWAADGNGEVTPRARITDSDGNEVKVNEDGSINIRLVNQYREYRIMSTDPFPEPKPEEKGATCWVMDRSKYYYNSGVKWEEM